MRGGADKSLLPESVVGPKRREGVRGLALSAVVRELRRDKLTPAEWLAEAGAAAAAGERDHYRHAVQGLADTYAHMTGDPTAAALIRDYVQRREPRLDRETIEAMRAALQVAAMPDGGYAAQPEMVRNCCLEMCIALCAEDDNRLLLILDEAESRKSVGQDQDLINAQQSAPTAGLVAKACAGSQEMRRRRSRKKICTWRRSSPGSRRS